jgi:uncharacterized protein
MDSVQIALYAFAAMFAAGTVKGVVGLGLPLVALPLLTMTLGLKSAISMLIVPIIASNTLQSLQGRRFKRIARRFWPVYVPLVACSFVGSSVLVFLPERAIEAALGVLVITIPLIAHFQPNVRITRAQERWLGPLTGALSGLLGGATSLYGPPLMIFLAGLRLVKDDFVVAVSLIFLIGSLGLGAGLISFGITRPIDLAWSLLGCVPVFLGLWAGQQVRARLDERRFAHALLVVYVASGTSFLYKAFA